MSRITERGKRHAIDLQYTPFCIVDWPGRFLVCTNQLECNISEEQIEMLVRFEALFALE